VVGGVQTREDFRGVQAGGFGEGAGNHFKGLGVFFDGVLREIGRLLAKGGYALDKLHFRRSRTGNEFCVSGDGFDDIDTVVNGALDVVEVVLGGPADDQGRGPGGVIFLPEDCDAVAADLKGFDNVDVAHFVGHGGAQAGERGGADNAAEAAELEFREDFDEENGEAVKVVHC